MARLSKRGQLGNVKLCLKLVLLLRSISDLVAYRTNDLLCVPGETSLPGLDGKNNLTSLISTLQATLKANVQNSPKQSPKIHPSVAANNANDPFSSSNVAVHQSTSSLQSFNSLQQSSNSLSSNSFQFQSANSLSSIPQPTLVPLQAPTTVQNHSRLPSLEQPSGTPDQHESKIAWKIRDPKKKRQKHITLGLTREEFANIQESLRHRPVKCK